MEKTSYKYEVIHNTLQDLPGVFSITILCELAGVSRSGYYAWVKAAPVREKREAQDRADFELILTIYKKRGYAKGARSIYMGLLHLNPPVVMNIKKIRRLMKKYNLFCPIRKANPYRRMAKAIDFVKESVEILIRDHGISLHKETLIHSDQGSHYTSATFIRIVEDAELRRSMSRRGNCWDNAPQESFFGHMKDHIIGKIKTCTEFQQVKEIVDDYMDYYNNEEYVWELCMLSPNEYYKFVTTGVYPLAIDNPPKVPEILKPPTELGKSQLITMIS